MTDTLKRLKTRIRLRYIPAVSFFQVASKEYLANPLLFGILKKSRTFSTKSLKNIDKRNKYLSRNYSRLLKYAHNNEIAKFEKLAMTLIRSSSSYQMSMLCYATNKWYTKTVTKVLKLWSNITTLREGTEITYSRWWIDKKPGDHARPIGAPTLEWKVTMLKYLQILEIYYHAKQMYPAWQHAGTAKRGLVTAWKDVLFKALPSKYIYEFDIKGFFDNIHNQDSVRELPTINEILNKLVNSKPKWYNVPPEEEAALDMNTLFKLVGIRGLLEMDHVVNEDGSVTFDLLSGPKDSPNRAKQENAMSYLAISRDLERGLGFKNHGFPQGANFSPFLSCLVLAKALKSLPGLIMYMDDGVIYASNKAELSQRIRRLKERLDTIGLSIAEEKSGIIKSPGIFKGIKFLGIRVDPLEQMRSETRKGTIQPAIIGILPRETYENLAYMLDVDESYDELITEMIGDKLKAMSLACTADMTASETRVKDWILNKATSKLEGLKWAAKKGFFSNIVAEIFNPDTSENARKQLAGELEKLDKCLKPRSLSSQILAKRMGRSSTYIPDIETITGEACLRIFKQLRRRISRGGVRKRARR
jgi:hypothetical protein